MHMPSSIVRSLLASLLVVMSCATATPTPQAMRASDATPAGQGTIRVEEGPNGSTTYSVSVKHLAPPGRMADEATVYVVWVQQRNQPAQNAGELGLNANLEGTFTSMTPLRRFYVMVTPEPSALVTRPSHDAVFSGEVDRVN
jgi:hypothetical protein